jgi:Tol biopolymer transport system component
LSDGRTLAYRIIPRSAEYSKTRLALTTIDGDKPVVLPFEVVMCLGAIDNWLIVVRRDRTLLAIPFDPQSRTATGQPVALSERANVVGWLAMAALSSSGTLAVGTGTDLTDLVWTDGHGAARPILSQLRGYDLPRLSPDGKRLAVMISPSVGSGLGGNYWVYDFTTSTLTQLTTDTASYYGEWLGDSRTFVYGQGRKGAWKLMRQPVDGSGPAVALLDDGAFHDFAVTPDGRQLIYATGSQPGQRGLRIRSVSGDTTSRPLVGFTGEEYAFRASPDGRWLAYAETRAGRTDVCARPIPGPGPRVQISTEESTEPVWARDGRRLFYRSEDGRVMYAASVTMTSSNLTVTGRTKLFEGQYDWEDDDADYDVAPNGKDFMMVRYPLKSREIMVTVNWADAVRQRLKGSSGR